MEISQEVKDRYRRAMRGMSEARDEAWHSWRAEHPDVNLLADCSKEERKRILMQIERDTWAICRASRKA